jgi:5'-deoxynucleotidase
MGNSSFFAFLSRMRYIGRWGLMRSSIPENLQEHSHMTAVFAHALGIIRRELFHVPCDAETLAALALYHDASEILTGDLPTPIKYQNPDIRLAYKQVEKIAVEKMNNMLPVGLQEAYREFLSPQGDETLMKLLKAADKLSAYVKCIEERKAGNNEFLSAEIQTRAALEAMDLPELRYFLDNFLPAFEMDLDRLGTMDRQLPVIQQGGDTQ